ncbi:hypothetical protein VNO77_24535 [Canavalia gladiata]|uniref:NAC domain-containing protein n=1 Tax=Canavalia gladiata TaxID=3824 RepID=A0AAN9L6H6_CANGL
MEKVSVEENMDLPPGFRFHPTDEELITHYLYNKVIDTNFCARAIGEVDLNRSEPWDLPWKAKMGEKEWYFFCVRDRKYPTGLRTNRATEKGYWKATGKDKEIFRGKSLVGMKKTLVFYKGRAPKGEKSDWVMHEYRLEGKFSLHNLPKTAKKEWVICRVFQKSSAGKKTHISGIIRLDSFGNELPSSSSAALPPLTDSSPSIANTKPLNDSVYVPCFSNPINLLRNQQLISDSFTNSLYSLSSSNPSDILPRMQPSPSFYSTQAPPNFPFPSSSVYGDHTLLRTLCQNNASNDFKSERDIITVSQETGLTADINAETSSVVSNFDLVRTPFHSHNHAPVPVAAPLDLDTFWSY